MHGKHLFEYAVIRVVPRVEREEFLNAGVILFCAKQKFLKAMVHLDENKVKAMCADIDCEEIIKNLTAFVSICEGKKNSGLIGQLDLPSRFRWLSATRSTVVQTSKVHPGFCTDAAEMLDRLYIKLVL